jgi:hypothetical protein
MRSIGLLCVLVALLAACAAPPARAPSPTAQPTQPATVNSVQTIIDDMTKPHDATLHGVPASYDWAAGPRMGHGPPPADFAAFIPWGQVYEPADGNPAPNTRVHLRDIRAYVLSRKTGQWQLLTHSDGVEGNAFREDFSGNDNKPADAREEPGGGVSVRTGDGYNFHFWSRTGRQPIDPNDVAGVFTTVQGRLILDDSARPDDRATARYLLGMGGDYWRSLTAQWDAAFNNVGDAAIGRMKFVASEWQAFNMTTLPADEIRKNPPPLK